MQYGHGTYIGPREDLRGERAMIRLDGLVLEAQFDNFDLAPLCYGWHAFAVEEFEQDKPVEVADAS